MSILWDIIKKTVAPPILMYGVVTEVDEANKRVKLKISGYTTSIYAIYDPKVIYLEVGDVLAVAVMRGTFPNVTILSKVSRSSEIEASSITDI